MLAQYSLFFSLPRDDQLQIAIPAQCRRIQQDLILLLYTPAWG